MTAGSMGSSSTLGPGVTCSARVIAGAPAITTASASSPAVARASPCPRGAVARARGQRSAVAHKNPALKAVNGRACW